MNINIKVVYLGFYEKFHIKTEQRLFHLLPKIKKRSWHESDFLYWLTGLLLLFFFFSSVPTIKGYFCWLGEKRMSCFTNDFFMHLDRNVKQWTISPWEAKVELKGWDFMGIRSRCSVVFSSPTYRSLTTKPMLGCDHGFEVPLVKNARREQRRTLVRVPIGSGF